MKSKTLIEALALVNSWPDATKQELAGIIEAMDTALHAGVDRTGTGDTMIIPTMVSVLRISDAERTELLTSPEQSRADIAAGNFDVLKPGDLRAEFEAIVQCDASDEELDTMLGVNNKQPPESQ